MIIMFIGSLFLTLGGVLLSLGLIAVVIGLMCYLFCLLFKRINIWLALLITALFGKSSNREGYKKGRKDTLNELGLTEKDLKEIDKNNYRLVKYEKNYIIR